MRKLLLIACLFLVLFASSALAIVNEGALSTIGDSIRISWIVNESLSSSSYPPSDPPDNWSSSEGPYSVLGNWIYSGNGSCWIDGYGNVLINISNGKLELTGDGVPGDETVTYVKDSCTTTFTADGVYSENTSLEGVTNVVFAHNYAEVSNGSGLIEEFFLLSDDTMMIHKSGSTTIGSYSIEDVDIWYSALRNNSGGGGGGCNTGEFNYSVVLLLLPLMLILLKPKRFFQLKYFNAIFLLIAIISVLIIPTSCYASKPFNPSQEATRSQACDHMIDACYGGYFWTGNGHQTPFLPKGFPTWKMRKDDVIKILGDDLRQKELYGTEVLCYKDFDVLFQAGKLVGFHFDAYLHKIMEQNLLRPEISDWRRVYPPEESNYETKDTDPHRSYKVRFATYRRSNPRYSVIAWVEESGGDEGSYVCLSSFAKDMGILK